MDREKTSLRVGIAALLCALTLRLFSPSVTAPLLSFLNEPNTVAFLIYAETGRHVRFSSSGEILPEQVPAAALTYFPESPAPTPAGWVLPAFSALPELSYDCSYRPDIEAMFRAPLSWDLRGESPKVLIYHTHTTESFEKFGADYEETAPYRTLNPDYNILSIGSRVAELLEDAGIPVLHDRQVHDYPDYNTSYMHSRLAEQKLLKENPGILLALDIHRDAVEGPEGQIRTVCNVGGAAAARIMVVVGTNCRLKHDRWPENLSLGLKLQAQLEKQTPGIARPLSLRPQRFNQDLIPGALLIEVGTAGNSHGEAMLAAQELAEALIALSRGTATIDSLSSDSAPP